MNGDEEAQLEAYGRDDHPGPALSVAGRRRAARPAEAAMADRTGQLVADRQAGRRRSGAARGDRRAIMRWRAGRSGAVVDDARGRDT